VNHACEPHDLVASGRDAAWAELGPAALADHVQQVHHVRLAHELPRLRDLAVTVYSAHREHHPELDDLIDAFDELHDDLVPHLAKEDTVLFPLIRELAAARGRSPVPGMHLHAPIRVMLAEHDESGRQLDRLRATTKNYETPGDADAEYRALYVGLRELDTDVRLHLYKETNLLFPAALALEAGAGRSSRTPGPHP
jgi:regulator of cell morphogenesis and NO signaling